MDSNIKHLYDTMISRGYTGLGDFSNFEGKMKDSGKRKLVYDHLMQDDYFSEIGDFSKFESALGYSPVERKDYVSQSRANPAPIALRQEVDVPMKDQSEYVNPWDNSADYNFESLRKKGKIETATPPPPTEYEKDSSFMNTWVGDAIQKLNAGGADLGAGIFGVLDKESKGLESSTGGLISRGGAFKDISDRFKADAEFSRARSNRYNGKDFIDLWKEGNYMGAIGDIALQGIESLPMSIGAMAATMAGAPAAGLAGIGSIVASQKYDDLDQNNPNMGEFAKVSNAIITGTAESLSEMLGAGVSKAWMSTLFKTLGKEKAQEAIKRGIMGKMQELYKKFGMFFEPVNEGVEEVSSTLAENITDKITGADPERDLTDGVLQSFVYGMGGGAYFTGTGALAKGAQYVADKIGGKQAQQPITDSNVTDQGVNTPPQSTKSIIDDAFEQGRNMSDKGDLRDLSLQMEASRTALTEKNPNLAIRMEQYIDNGASENQINEMLKGVDNETRELAYDFYINTQKIKGVEDKSIENINNEVDSYMSDNIIPYVSISPNGRQVISTATFKEGLENKKVYIRSINGDNVIISDNGNNRMVPMSSLSDIEENDVEQIRNSYRQQLLVTRQSELDMAMNHNPKTQLPKPGLIVWNGDNAFILQGQDENGDWIAQPAAYDRETGQVTAKNGSSPAMPITENEILDLQDAIYDAQQVNVVSPEDDNVASADAEITSAPPVEDAINQPTSEIETEGAIDQIAQPSNVENPSMVMREDGTPDFVSSGVDATLDFLHDKYGEKMPKKIEVTRKAFDEDLKKTSEKLDKAQEAYDNAPIGKEDKVEAALIKARQEYDAIKVEADFWANLDNRLKEESEKATATSGQVIDISEKEDTEPVDIKNEDVVTQEGASGEVKESGSNLFNYFTGSLSELIEQAKKSAGKLIKKIVAPVSDRLRNDLEIKGVSITSDYNHVIDNNAIRHTLKQHGGNSEIKRGQVPVNDSDFDKISDIVENYDDIKVEDGKRGDVNIIYSKTFNDGTTIFVEEKRDKRKELAAVTMWKMKNPILTGANSDNATPIPDLNRIKRQAEREGGELLILTPKRAAASLSTFPDNSSSTDKGSISSSENQANEAKSFVAPSPKESENPLDYAERIVEAKRLHDEELKVDTTPSEAQKEAGNYKKGHIKINGFDVTIEQPASSVRSGKDVNGKEWSVTMSNTYGYIRGTEGVDGDHIDVFLGPDMNSDMVYVVDQVNTDGSFDEHKVMMGFPSLEDARSAYLSNYEEGWKGLGNITGVTLDGFKKWIDSSTRKTKPFSEYKSVKAIEEKTNNEKPQMPLTEDEYAEQRSKEIMGDNPGMDDIGAYNQALDEYPSYIRKMVDNGSMRDSYLKGSVGERIKLGKIMNAAGFELSEISKGLREESIMESDFKVGDKVTIRFYDGLYHTGEISKMSKDRKVTVSADGKNYTVSQDRILSDSDVRFRPIGEKGATNLNNAETIESSINDWSNKLNTPVRVIHDVDDITDTDENMLARKRDSKGWYDTSTGEIVIVSPNSTSVGDAQRTFLHEVVGHHGLRELFGDDFDTFLDNVYRNANEDIRKNIIDRTKGNPLNLREATEEYIAELAERGFDNKAERSLWEKIKDAFLDMLRKAGISLDFKLSDNDLRYILWRSYKNLEQGNLMDVAEDTVMRNDLGIGDFSVRFREAKTEVENEEPLNKEMVDAWDKVASSDSFKFKEAMVDSLTAIDEFLKLLAKKTKSKILDYENPYYALIALSSKNKADMDSFDSKFLNPLNEAIRALIGDVSEVSKKGLRRTWDWSKGPLRDLVKYVQSKHGIERNRDMSVRDGIENLKAFDVDALSKMGVISDSDLKNAKKTAEKVAEEKGSEAYKKTYDKVLGKELKKGVDKGKAERSAEIAADYRKSFVKSEIYNKEMDKYKEKVTGTLIDRWEDSKKDVLNKDLAWDEEQKELDREALSFQWKLGDNSYGVILGKDYSGLSSVFKSSEDGANKDKWLSDAYDFVRDYESTHNMVLVDNLWDKVHNVSEYTLRRQYESGLISKSYMDKNLSRFKYFIPLRGFSDNIASDVYDYIDATEIKMGNPVKTAKGRISEADNPFAGLIHVGYGSITAGNRNLAKQRFLNLASNHDTGGLITIDNIWVRNVGTEENPEWVESIPQIPDNASGEEVAKAVKDHEEMMRELREEGKAELIKGGRSDIPYKTLYDQRSQHQVQVFVGGNRYVMTVNGNPRLAQAVNGLTNPDVKDDLAYVVARNLKTFMAGAFTSKNVAFSFANLIRDTPYANNSVFVTENFRYFKDFSGNQRRALFGLRSLGRNLYKYRRGEIDISDKEQAIFKEFMDNGGATGYTFVETQKEYAKDLANKLEKLSDGNIGKLSPKELVSTVFECFEFMGNVAELVNRYAAYKTSREHGRSIDRSINDAKEVSVNFNKKGAGKKTKSDKWYINTAAWISEYGRDWVLFFNAAVQSMYKEYSMLRNHPIKGIGSRIAPLIFMGSSVSLLNNLFMPMLFAYLGWDSDDDDRDYFDSLSDHERQNNICIRLTHGRWLKIPLSPELANYFKIGDIIAGQLSGKREVEAMDVVKTGIDMVSPLNINWEYDSWKFALNLLPTVVQPIAQNASNVNFMGNPIYKTSMNKANDYDPEYTKVYRSTSTTMVELSRALNSLTGGDDVKRGLSFNPATWQNIFSGYTGGFGTVALGVSDLVLDILSGEDGDMPVSRYPLLSRFLTGGDKDLKLSRMNSIYNKKVVDFVSEMDHDYKGYLEKSMDPSINILDRAEYIVKLEKFMKSDDFKKSQELSQYVRAISDMERFLREVGSDNDSLENQVYELKLRALEIFEDSDE
nr:MAG TPA: Type I restriction enzyme [Caudoviricetes sp.]